MENFKSLVSSRRILFHLLGVFLLSCLLFWTACTKYNYEVEEFADTLIIRETITLVDSLDTLIDTVFVYPEGFFPTGTFLADISFDTTIRRDERIFKIYTDSTGELYGRRDSILTYESYWNWTFQSDTLSLWNRRERSWHPLDSQWTAWNNSQEIIHFSIDSLTDSSFTTIDSLNGEVYLDYHKKIGDMNYDLNPFRPPLKK